MVETLAFILFWQRLPIELSGLKEGESAHHISTSEGEWIFDRTVNMTLCCQVDDAINLFLLHQLVECIEVADVHLHELLVGLILNIFEACQITCIGQLIEVDDIILGILIYEKADNMTSDKACTTCDYDVTLHIIFYILNLFILEVLF